MEIPTPIKAEKLVATTLRHHLLHEVLHLFSEVDHLACKDKWMVNNLILCVVHIELGIWNMKYIEYETIHI